MNEDVINAQYPGNLDASIRFFDRFTLRDIARIGIPTTVGGLLGGPIGGAVGGVLGGGLYWARPFGTPLDTHAANAAHLAFDRHMDVWPDGVTLHNQQAVAIDDGPVIGAVAVDSCDLTMLSEAEQRALHSTYHDLFTADHPIEIHARQRPVSLTDYQIEQEDTIVTDHVVLPTVSRTTTSTPVHALKQALADRFDLPLTTDTQRSTEAALTQLDDRCRAVRTTLTGGALSAHRLTGEEFTAFLHRVAFGELQLGNHQYEIEDAQYGAYRKGVQLCDLPNELPVGWMATLLAVDGLVDIVQVVDPLAGDVDDLSSLRNKTQAELTACNNPQREAELEERVTKIEELLSLIARREEQLADYGIYIVAKGPTESAMEAAFQNVTRQLRTLQIDYVHPVLRTHRMARADSVLHPHTMDTTMLAPGGSIAAGLPFATGDAITDTGVVFGTTDTDNKPVILDRFAWKAPHIARFGATGAGKTMAAKLTLLRSINNYDDLRVYIIDPKPEYGDVIDLVGGDTHDIEHDTDIPAFAGRFGRYTFASDQAATHRIADAVNQLKQQTQDDTTKTICVVDEAHRLTSTDSGVATLSRFLREGRASRTSVEVITQNTADFTASTEGKNMLRNIDGTVLMMHEDVTSSVDTFFRLSENESTKLRKLKTGDDVGFSEAIIRISRTLNTQMRIEATPSEKDLLNGQRGES